MIFEEDLHQYLDSLTFSKNAEKTRNIKLIKHHYGFRHESWPTLEQTAKEFGVSKQRVRQIIDETFLSIASHGKNIKNAKLFADIINSHEFLPFTEFLGLLQEAGMVIENINSRGILNLLHDIQLCKDYEIYSPELIKVTREIWINKSNREFFIIKQDKRDQLNTELKFLKKVPAQLGIARLDTGTEHLSCLLSLIKASQGSWIFKADDSYWYLFETRLNRLINYLEKISCVTLQANINELAETLHDALFRKTGKKAPPITIIKHYLEESSFTDLEGNILILISFEGQLNKIEKDVFHYLRKNISVRSQKIKSYLIDLGHTEANVNQIIYNSPIVCVDKSKGRRNYHYHLIGDKDRKDIFISPEKQRYLQYRQRLQNLLNTDISKERSERLEQGILQEWLFKERKADSCAICGNGYEVSALVTAHKKKRKDCTDNERKDPHIVMPVCLFGCDYLYENQFIYVDKGIIRINPNKEINYTTKNIVDNLEGNQLKSKWLQGPPSYFNNPLR